MEGTTNADNPALPFPNLEVRREQPSSEEDRSNNSNQYHRPLSPALIPRAECQYEGSFHAAINNTCTEGDNGTGPRLPTMSIVETLRPRDEAEGREDLGLDLDWDVEVLDDGVYSERDSCWMQVSQP